MLSERLFKMDNFSFQRVINRITLLKYRYLGCFLFDYDPTLDNETLSIINTHPSNVQDEQWIMIAKFRHEMYFADSLERTKYHFLNQQYQQMMPSQIQFHSSVSGFYKIYAAFPFFKFCQKKNWSY